MILNANGLSFRYKSSPVIENASFSLQEGEVLSLLGPNGAGKTTLLKCLNRILVPQGGSVLLDGTDSRTMSTEEIARKIGWVPQHSKATRMKVYDLILLGRKPFFHWAPSKKDHEIVEDAIKIMDIENLAMRYADEISGGEFQLVQIVRVLAQRPKIILFDEPTSSLDISRQHQLMSKIVSLIHSNTTASVITMHDINLALRYSDKFILLKDGYIHAAGGREIITPEIIKSVYNMDAEITEACGQPVVIPV